MQLEVEQLQKLTNVTKKEIAILTRLKVYELLVSNILQRKLLLIVKASKFGVLLIFNTHD